MTLEIEAAPVAAPAIAAPETPSSTPVEAVEAVSEDTGSMDETLSSIYRKNNPDRDDTGRFRSREPAPEVATTETEVLPDQPPTEEPKQAVTPAIQPPQSWSAEEKAEWATLTPKAQEAIARRERESQQTLSRMGNDIGQLKALEPVRNVIEQNRDIFERNGVTPDDGIGRLLAANRMLEQDAPSAIITIAEAYGVDLAQLVNGQGQQPAGNLPPEVGQLHQRIAYLESQLNQTSSRIEQRERAEAETQQRSMSSLIEKFSADKSDWADLETDILAELVGINAAISQNVIQPMTADEKLNKAYERALRNNPDAWNRKVEAERKAEEAKRVEEARKRTEDSRKAKAVNITTTPARGPVIRSMDDTLRETFRKSQASG